MSHDGYDRDANQDDFGSPMSIVEHLEELRTRLFISVGAWLVSTAGGWFLAQELLDWLMLPARQAGASFMIIGPQEALFTLMRLSFLLGLIFSAPVLLYETAAFAWPGLTRKEKRAVLVGLPLVLLLFTGGIAFAYFILLRYIFRFFLAFTGPDLAANLTLGSYISFVTGLLLPFGFVFQLPVLVAVLSYIGIITPSFLRRSRKFALLVILVVSAILTPPDVVSQLIMSLPLYLLYEASVWVSELVSRRKKGEPGVG